MRTHDAGCAMVRLECLPDGEHWTTYDQGECMECGAECSCGTRSYKNDPLVKLI